MNKEKPNTRKTVLTFAGSDSSSLAGIQADIKTQSALGAHCLSIITATTAQNNQTVFAINATQAEIVKQQVSAVQRFNIHAIKSGLLANKAQIDVLADTVEHLNLPYVCDPVLSATAGQALAQYDIVNNIKQRLIPKCDLITPNIPEVQTLTGMEISTANDIEQAAKSLCDLGAKAVYIKGGHIVLASGYVQDYFYSRERAFWLTSKKIETKNTRGTGCAFASAVAAARATGYPIYDAVVIAKMAVNQGLRKSYGLARSGCDEKGPLNIEGFPTAQIDLPYLTQCADFNFQAKPFAECDDVPLGLYPVVDSADWLARLLPLGITTAQIRNKDLTGQALEAEIKRAIALGKRYNCRLFINDYWELAMKHGAYGVHLGQEDLDEANIETIREAGLRLGTSTHCHYEVARAHALKPSYIACGPVYHTNTKDMPWRPHDLTGLQYWQNTLDYPLVAIGGINRARIPAVAKTGVSGVAMITAITLADSPEETTKDFMSLIGS